VIYDHAGAGARVLGGGVILAEKARQLPDTPELSLATS
jgi:hypothetical protein